MSDNNLTRLLALDFDHYVFRTYPGGPFVDPTQMSAEQMQKAVSELEASIETRPWTDEDRCRMKTLIERATARLKK